ncbi:MAG: glucokinase [Nannocystaceae bacterium]
MRLLAGDIGGTKTDLALYAVEDEGLRELRHARLPSGAYRDLEAMLREFLGDSPPSIDAAAFGVAGPVVGERSRTTNLPWIVDAPALRSALATPRVQVVNDFHALALGALTLTDDQEVILQPGERDPDGARAILGAGTGLGVAIVVPGPEGPRVLASEGGHVDFAPRDEREIALLRRMLARHRRVSAERVISGPGLREIYDLLVEDGHVAGDPALEARFEAEDPGAVIGEAAALGRSPACVEAARLFLSLLGAQAGNLALTVLPRGGLTLAGGVAPRLVPHLGADGLLASFLDKGRMRPLLERVHVTMVTEPRVGLLGAAALAHRLASR